jgi:Tol biopolymer transport system component
MKQKIIFIGIIILTVSIFSNFTQQDDFPVFKGSYLGQKPPGMTPEIFAPGILSTGYSEAFISFTPDGKELFYSLSGAPYNVIFYMKEENGRWTKPKVAPFSGKYWAEFNISPDGKKIALSTRQPLDCKGEPKKHAEIWIVKRTDTGWGEPKNLGPPINSEKSSNAYPSFTKNDNLYFSSVHEGSMNNDYIYMSKFVEGRYTEPHNLGDAINSELPDVDPFIAPDESYLIFFRINDRTGADLYISFKNKDGSWTKATNMGEKINSTAREICPRVTPDGKYFFFSSNRRIHKPFSEVPITYEEKIKILNSPGNGSYDIYWVDAKVIEILKPKEIK